MPDAEDDATALFKRFIAYDGDRRVAAAEATGDPYFRNSPLPARLCEMPVPSAERSKREEEEGRKRRRQQQQQQQQRKAKDKDKSSGSDFSSSSSKSRDEGATKTFAEIFEDLLALKY